MPIKVMLADDEENVLLMLFATLADPDRYHVIVARDGEQAIKIARRERPALLFLDIKMPKIDGYEVCETLKQSPDTAGIKIIMLTGLSEDLHREKADLAGADGYFTKPFSPAGLMEKIDQVLDEVRG